MHNFYRKGEKIANEKGFAFKSNGRSAYNHLKREKWVWKSEKKQFDSEKKDNLEKRKANLDSVKTGNAIKSNEKKEVVKRSNVLVRTNANSSIDKKTNMNSIPNPVIPADNNVGNKSISKSKSMF